MERGELQGLVDAVTAAFNLEAPLPSTYRTWYRYLGDLELRDVMRAFDAYVISGTRWAPKVGELRRAALDRRDGARTLPDPDGAWRIVEHRLEASNQGIEIPTTGSDELDEAISAAMRAARVTGGYDRTTFLAEWRRVLADDEAVRYGIPDDAAPILVEKKS